MCGTEGERGGALRGQCPPEDQVLWAESWAHRGGAGVPAQAGQSLGLGWAPGPDPGLRAELPVEPAVLVCGRRAVEAGPCVKPAPC